MIYIVKQLCSVLGIFFSFWEGGLLMVFFPPQKATVAVINNILSTSLWIESSLFFSVVTPNQNVTFQAK